ncbi:MAG: hypothetical protein OXC03_05815 [Flavobacteriaceae bacterium]|nr:hypothetical protein [Flavobacteriaceae bacterium]
MGKTLRFKYTKALLEKVSFNKRLFYKELNKAYDNLNYDESIYLNRWVLYYIRKNPQLNR